ncbi:hypothetical protein [Nocardia gipuzkoensis]
MSHPDHLDCCAAPSRISSANVITSRLPFPCPGSAGLSAAFDTPGLDNALGAVTSAAAAVTGRQVVLTATKSDRFARDMAAASQILTSPA